MKAEWVWKDVRMCGSESRHIIVTWELTKNAESRVHPDALPQNLHGARVPWETLLTDGAATKERILLKTRTLVRQRNIFGLPSSYHGAKRPSAGCRVGKENVTHKRILCVYSERSSSHCDSVGGLGDIMLSVTRVAQGTNYFYERLRKSISGSHFPQMG